MSRSLDYLPRSLLHGSTETLVLKLLAEGPCHGYRLRQELAERSAHRFQLSFGRLYPLLTAMARTHLIRRVDASDPRAHLRTLYALTDRGRDELVERLRRWDDFARAMDQVLHPRPRRARR